MRDAGRGVAGRADDGRVCDQVRRSFWDASRLQGFQGVEAALVADGKGDVVDIAHMLGIRLLAEDDDGDVRLGAGEVAVGAEDCGAAMPLGEQVTAVLHHSVAKLQIEFHVFFSNTYAPSHPVGQCEHADVQVNIHAIRFPLRRISVSSS